MTEKQGVEKPQFDEILRGLKLSHVKVTVPLFERLPLLHEVLPWSCQLLHGVVPHVYTV